jgi:predicted SprT family Zn-dependent metalloprotease
LDFPAGTGAWNADPVATTFTYQCACGAAFIRTVKMDPPSQNRGAATT